jgi:hypothetical protein
MGQDGTGLGEEIEMDVRTPDDRGDEETLETDLNRR